MLAPISASLPVNDDTVIASRITVKVKGNCILMAPNNNGVPLLTSVIHTSTGMERWLCGYECFLLLQRS